MILQTSHQMPYTTFEEVQPRALYVAYSSVIGTPFFPKLALVDISSFLVWVDQKTAPVTTLVPSMCVGECPIYNISIGRCHCLHTYRVIMVRNMVSESLWVDILWVKKFCIQGHSLPKFAWTLNGISNVFDGH